MNKPGKIIARVGGGRFQWNTGAWFGSSIGSTAWMLIAACFLVANRQLLLSFVPIGGFLVASWTAWALWTKRDRITPFQALIAQLTVLAVLVPATFFAIKVWGSLQVLSQMNWPSSSFWDVVVSLLVPAMIGWFFILERDAKRQRFAKS